MTDFGDDLDAALSGGTPDYDGDPELPNDTTRAGQLLYALGRAKADEAEIERLAAARIAEIEAWRDDRVQAPRNAQKWLTASLERFHAAMLAVSPRAKTIRLPEGDLISRQGQPMWVFDVEAFLPWARENLPGAVRPPKPKPDEVDVLAVKAALTRRDEKGEAVAWGVTEDGEKPPGVTVEPAVRTYDQKPRPRSTT